MERINQRNSPTGRILSIHTLNSNVGVAVAHSALADPLSRTDQPDLATGLEGLCMKSLHSISTSEFVYMVRFSRSKKIHYHRCLDAAVPH